MQVSDALSFLWFLAGILPLSTLVSFANNICPVVDHVYWIWQRLHPSEASTIAATITALNEPPSRDARLNDTVDLSEILKTPPEEIQRLLSTTAGPFCYTYA